MLRVTSRARLPTLTAVQVTLPDAIRGSGAKSQSGSPGGQRIAGARSQFPMTAVWRVAARAVGVSRSPIARSRNESRIGKGRLFWVFSMTTRIAGHVPDWRHGISPRYRPFPVHGREDRHVDEAAGRKPGRLAAKRGLRRGRGGCGASLYFPSLRRSNLAAGLACARVAHDARDQKPWRAPGSSR